jgi:uncharacterized protein DUF1579
MDMPKPGDAHKRLSALVGSWSGTETLQPAPWDPAGGSAKARVSNRSILDGFGVVQEYEQERGGKVNFRGHGVFWYDDQKKEYVMTWWDSMAGRPGEYRGHFNGNVLELSSPMPQGGHSRTKFDLANPDKYGFVMEISPDGQQWQTAMEGRYAKANASDAGMRAKPGVRKPAPRAKKAPAKKPAAKSMRKAGKKSKRR